MRVNKLTFLQSRIKNKDIQQQQNYVNILGIFVVLFFILTIVYPFYSSYRRGKIGLNDLTNNKYNLISTALRHVHQPSQYIIMIISITLTTIFLHNKGFFGNLDKRVIVPISLYGTFICIFLLTKVIPEKFIIHNIIGVVYVLFGLLLVFFIDESYSSYFVDSDLQGIHTLKTTFIILIIIGFCIGFFNIYNNYLRKVKLFPKYIPMVRNLLGFTEISIFTVICISFAIMITYPPLPDTKPELTVF